jgi:hypothetical protein
VASMFARSLLTLDFSVSFSGVDNSGGWMMRFGLERGSEHTTPKGKGSLYRLKEVFRPSQSENINLGASQE